MATDPLGLGSAPAATTAKISPRYGLPNGAVSTVPAARPGPTGPGGRYERGDAEEISPFGAEGGGYTSVDVYELASLPAETLARLQRQMVTAGLIKPGTARLGLFDGATRSAIEDLFDYANTVGKDYRNALDELSQAGGMAAAKRQQAANATPQYDTKLNEYSRTDPAALRLTAEQAFQDAIGRKPKPDELAKFVKRFQDSEFNQQRTAFTARDANDRANIERGMQAKDAASMAESGGDGIDAFMSALSAQESGGDYSARNGRTGASGRFQIMPKNWAPWAREAGLGANAERTAENQDVVARFKMQQYYDQFGSWDAVAVAWYAGPDDAERFLKNPNDPKFTRRPAKNEPSINEYVQQVRGRMGRGDEGGSEAEKLQARLQKMIADAPGPINLGKPTRSYEEQVALWEKYKRGGPKAAKPGTSKHGDGRANDLQYGSEEVRQWVLQNAGRYGLALPIYDPSKPRTHDESWHVELADSAPTAIPGILATGVRGGPPLSTSISTTNLNPAAQAAEFARASNPAETQAYDIGSQFNNFVGILSKGVI